METRRWTNPSQPQTLYLAVILLYIEAVTSLIFGNLVGLIFGFTGVLVFMVGAVASAYGIANEQRWGYIVGVGVAAFQLVPFLWVLANEGIGEIFDAQFLIYAIIPVALFALLVHPMSREYQRIWFK